MEQKPLNQFVSDFISRLRLPGVKAGRSFVVATIGLPGSGRSTVAKMFAEKLQGAVLVRSNSARYLLKEASLLWGENVRQILKGVAIDLLGKGYGVVFDGNAADEEDRRNISEIASQSDAKMFYVKINIDPEIAKEREQRKYDDRNWVSSFDNFRVNTTEKMLKNIDDRAELHKNLKDSEIPNLVGVIDNDGSKEDLERQVSQIIDGIQL